ncbi:MAG: prephenate dehydratase [Candidatus Omnitrophica bacterium]|nr:prephenate dehydratase [Candidatus Omnitrophota bacterium]
MLTVAYLGPEKTNTHAAAQARFGKKARYLHAPTIEDVFHLVERRKADLGVVPIENSLEGAVTHTLDRFVDFVDTPVKIQGEIERPILHFLILHKKASVSGVQVVFSHPQAMAQCRAWLDKHCNHVHRLETNSTAEAVEKVLDAQGDIRPLQRAAIGRADLAKAKGLKAIPIPEERENKTRFLILGLDEPQRGRQNKTSILIALKDKPGALHDALVPFKDNRINLAKIESRPSKQKAWEYLFFIDFEGYESEMRVVRALKALERSTTLLRILGSYPTR